MSAICRCWEEWSTPSADVPSCTDTMQYKAGTKICCLSPFLLVLTRFWTVLSIWDINSCLKNGFENCDLVFAIAKMSNHVINICASLRLEVQNPLKKIFFEFFLYTLHEIILTIAYSVLSSCWKHCHCYNRLHCQAQMRQYRKVHFVEGCTLIGQ